MIRGILKSIGLIAAYAIVLATVGAIGGVIGVSDIETWSIILRLGSIGWLVVIGICIHWIIEGFKKLVGKE